MHLEIPSDMIAFLSNENSLSTTIIIIARQNLVVRSMPCFLTAMEQQHITVTNNKSVHLRCMAVYRERSDETILPDG